MVRVVIDTNVVLSALLFTPTRAVSALAKLHSHWQSGEVVPVVSRATIEELMAALRYPKFQLSPDEQQHALAAYLPYCETHARLTAPKGVPVCRDPDDQPFVDLALSAKVDYLVTGDKDLLAMSQPLAALKVVVLKPNDLTSRLG